MKSEQGKMVGPSSGTSTSSVVHDTGRNHRHGRDTVEFSVKGPIGITINDENLANSGCAVLDLIFTAPSHVGELTFRNYYTMWLSILVKTKLGSPNSGSGIGIVPLPMGSGYDKEDSVNDWTMSVPRKVMMQNPHYETGSQDMISVPASESSVEWKNLVAMRIILRQPSPVWKTFHIEEINVYKDLPRRVPIKESPTEALMLHIKRQTIVALKWSPTPEILSQGCSGAYEFASLPQP